METRYKEKLNHQLQSIALPKAPKNYGVPSRHIIPLASLAALLTLIIIAIGIITFQIFLLFVSFLPILALVYILVSHFEKIRVSKDAYLLTVLSPWFASNFGYQLHTFDLARFNDGIAITAEKSNDEEYSFLYIFPRYDAETHEIYVSYVNGKEELTTLTDFVGTRFTYPRVSPLQVSKGKPGLLPENAYFKHFDTQSDSGIIVIPAASISDGGDSSGYSGGDGGGGGGDGGGGGGD